MPILLKKIGLLLVSFLVLFFSIAPNFMAVKAQMWYSQDPFDWYLKVYDQDTSPANEIFGERYTAAQVQWVLYGIISLPIRAVETVVGENTISCVVKILRNQVDVDSCVGGVIDFIDRVADFLPNVAFSGNSDRSIASLMFDANDRNISGIDYTKNLFGKFSLVSEVKAQGIGYTGLTWIQKYWKGFRDISYALLVCVAVIFAFMIMFRVKINPQTVISVQSAVPKVIVAMVLITFSYAIAGFAIDLMYVVSGLFALLLKTAGFTTNITGAFGTISGTGILSTTFGGFWIFFSMLAYTVLFFITSIFSLFDSFMSGLNIFGMILSFVFIIIGCWVLILCLWYTLKIPYVMLKTLVSLYISIITSPIQILAGTLAPSAGFGPWIKRLFADLLVFPMIGLLFWFAWSLLWSSMAQAGIDVSRYWIGEVFGSGLLPTAWVPDIIGSRGFGNSSGISGIILLAISFSMITLIPKVPDMLKGLILGEKFSFGTAIGEAAAPAQWAWGMTGAPLVKTAQEILSKDRLAKWGIGITKATTQKETKAEKKMKEDNLPPL